MNIRVSSLLHESDVSMNEHRKFKQLIGYKDKKIKRFTVDRHDGNGPQSPSASIGPDGSKFVASADLDVVNDDLKRGSVGMERDESAASHGNNIMEQRRASSAK